MIMKLKSEPTKSDIFHFLIIYEICEFGKNTKTIFCYFIKFL
jgi:hypothetical protein